MVLLSLLSSIAIIFSTHAFVIPSDISDGFYAVTNDNGVEVHNKLSDITSSPKFNLERSLNPRAEVREYCGCGFYMNNRNTDDAVAALKVQLDSNAWIYGPYSFFVIRGDVVAFFCVRSNLRMVPVSSQRYAWTLASLSGNCGHYVPATMKFNGWQDGIPWETVEGYMNHFPGLDFCTAATGSPLSDCNNW